MIGALKVYPPAGEPLTDAQVETLGVLAQHLAAPEGLGDTAADTLSDVPRDVPSRVRAAGR